MRVAFPGGGEKDLDVSPGESVVAAARRAGGAIHGPCRGHGRCGMCVVTVPNGTDLRAPGEAEARVLRILGARPDQRLACQARRVAAPDRQALA